MKFGRVYYRFLSSFRQVSCLLGVLLWCGFAKAQQHTRYTEDGVKQIIKQNNRLFYNLLEAPDSTKSRVTDSILKAPEEFIPPILFAVAQSLYQQRQTDKAVFWYYVAKLNALCDAHLGKEIMLPYGKKTVRLYTERFGQSIEQYTLSHYQHTQPILDSVKRKVEKMHPKYFKGWIYVDGNARNYDRQNLIDLFKPAAQWPAIRARVIAEFGQARSETTE